MTPSTPPPLPPAGRTASRGISLRKVALALVLAGSILFVFLLLCAGAVAIMREAAPGGRAGLGRALLAVRHIVAHHIIHHK